jgi:hypothetical protein
VWFAFLVSGAFKEVNNSSVAFRFNLLAQFAGFKKFTWYHSFCSCRKANSVDIVPIFHSELEG